MSEPEPEPDLPKARWLDRRTPPHIATLTLIAGISALNMNIFLPSLPSMAAYFDADYRVVQLAVSAYFATTAILQVIVGPLSDRYGRRPVLLWGMVIFLLATVGCILATDIVTFLVFRMIQAAVATGMVLSRAIVRDMVSADKAASMIGYVTMGMALVPMVGPMIGGVLDELYGWQASFAAVLVFGVMVTWLSWADLGETNQHRSTSFGAQFRSYPELVRSRRFWGYALAASFASGSFFAFLGGGPWVASEILGMTPTALGGYFALIAGGYSLGNFFSGLIAERMGLNRMMLLGGCVATGGILISIVFFAAGMGSPFVLFGCIGLVGIGNGLLLPSANAGIVSVRPHLAGSASGLGGALMIGGGAAISAVTGTLLSPETGAWPLLLMMLASSILSVVVAYYVIHVARQVAREAAADAP